MAKKDVDLTAGLTIDDVLVSKAAKDRIVRLRQELFGAKAEYKNLGERVERSRSYKQKESLLLGQREASNRMASLGRRLGYSPSQMADILTFTADVNRKLNSVRRALRAGDNAEAAAGVAAQRTKDLYEWVVDAAKEFEDPAVDQNRPSVQFFKRSVRSAAGKLLRTPGIENTLGTEQARKVAQIYDKLSENTQASTNLVQTIRSNLSAGAGGIALGSMLSSRAAAIYRNRETPFSELRGEINKGVKYIGGTLGAVIGGLAGPLGAAIGGALGSVIGGYAERSQEASDAAKQDTIQMLRMRHLYGRGSFNSAMLAQGLGYIDMADYQNIASAANVAPYAAAFGDISEKQWIGLSMMPNYMAAIFGGASPEEAMAAYQQDLGKLGTGLGQYATSLLGGLGLSENLRAFVTSDNFRRWQQAGLTLADYEQVLSEVAPGYEEALFNETLKNRGVRNIGVQRGTWTTSKYNYAGEMYGRPRNAEETIHAFYGEQMLPKFDIDSMGFVKRELIINIDNNRVDVGPVYTFDGDWLTGATSYSVGSNQ